MTWKDKIKKAPLPPDGDPTDPTALPRTIKQQVLSAIGEIESMVIDTKRNGEKQKMALIKLYRLVKHLEDPENY
jgi:hypothetical protein